MWREFKEFAIRGNALDLAIGVVIGAAFTTVVNSIVNDLFNPLLGLFVGIVEFRNIKIGLPGSGVLRVGSFLNASVNFLVIAFAVFILVKQLNRFRSKQSQHSKECPFCFSVIPTKATRCPACTSPLN